ncbi:arylamine N-acetyltransferase [Weeksellaceae bacterium KMM 9713]|uniref:Arylamine N-acetyltransferase n=1 Tax=Profundicola chukchiensis TaxID=2961959 RepID=A0A9X4RUW9_9FLAO|nr:arylamine N-acetyltransferase [Profundicola chukchiensis]MDG4946573.1 arylamine N-acetyltransferase [Profundicola chukchiensis]
MSDFNFNQEKYLKRINLNSDISVDFESLKRIHRAQHLSIPFENFDICLNRKIAIDPSSIFNKLVLHKRGGYCFENNALLLIALKNFGFEARPVLGRVHLSGEPGGRTHQSTLVKFGDDTWLVDAGFGSESPRTPIPLIPNEVVSFEGINYRIIQSEMYGYMLQNKTTDDWKNLYSFDLSPVLDIDLNLGNHFTSTSPDSFFMTARIAALPVENGIKTLYNDRLKKTINGQEENISLEDNATYLEVLEREFGIQLDADYSKLKPLN